MMLLTTVCLLLFLSHARAQGCAEIMISDLGSTDTAGTGGAIVQLFSGGESGNTPDILVTSSRTVCLAAAATRGNYRFASVITTYDCGGAAAGACPPGPYPRTDQFEFSCVGSVWQDSTFLTAERNNPVNPSITTLRRDCSFCISPDDATNIGITNPVDTETHCAGCNPSCLTGADGLGYCTNAEAAGCCNVYQPMNGVDTCAMSCDAGFEADPPLFLCERRCPVLSPPLNGTVSHPTRTVGSVATYTCDTDFAIVGGDEMRTCGATSAWDGEELDCSVEIIFCDPLASPENGQVTLTSRTVGSVANYSCEVGYNLLGSMMRTCQADTGVDWSDNEPTCQIADCGSLPDPANGDVTVTGTTFGSTATYSCIGSDYLLVGDTMRTCQADGTWNSTAPTCAEVCELLTNPVNGQVTLIERFVGEVANYSCDAGFALIGSETRTCQSGSGWSGDEPSCERVQVGFDPILYNVSESDGVAALVVRRFTPSSIPVTVLFSTQDGTAIAPDDYDAQTLTVVTIQPNEDSNTVPVTIALDGATEGLESLFGRLQAQSGEPVDIIQENATIEILDDDDTDISIERTTYITIEGIFSSVAICVAVTSGSLERDAIVSFFTVSDSATSTAPADYDATALELTFGPSNTRQCVPVTIVNDDILEGAENFRASLTTSDSAVILDTDTTQVSIIEDFSDGVTVGFEQTVYTTTERTDPSRELCVNVTSGTLERDVTVLFSTSDGTATFTAPIDYDMISVELTFGPGNNQRCVNVAVNDDDIVEATENFSAILTTLDPAVTLDPDTAQVEIRADPDDGIVIGFEMMSYTVTEGTDPSVELCAVVVSGTLERDAIVVFSTGNATAFAPADYDATNVDLTFGPADTRQCATVIIIDDNFGELTENFFATLTTSDSAVTLGTDMARVDILVDPNDVVDCGSLPDPANGMVAMTASTFDSTANYSCIGGYELVGNSQRICQADGQWSGSEPTCKFVFCNYDVSITNRGNYTWPETPGGNEVELECQLGPAVGVAPDTAIGRRRCNTSGEWEDPQLENCITMVALQLQQLEEALNNTALTEENVGEVNQDLREVIDEAGEEDQTVENLQVVASVFTTTAALLSEPTIPVEEDTVNNIVEVLDTIQVWPEEVLEDIGSDIVEVFEEIVTGLVEQENFTNLTFVGDDLIFTAESVEVEILVVAGRGFSSSRNENGNLGTTSGNVGDEEELLAPEEIATAFLSPSLFEQFESDAGSREVGIFFSLYESSSLFPIARESDSPTTTESEDDGGIMSQVGSPVVAATVSAGGRTEFPNLTDPVVVILRLNPVLDGNITRRTCVSYNFNLADGIGNWTSEGCKTNVSGDNPNIITCSCDHLTNFACLVDICTRTEGCELTSTARVVLEVLSIIGVVLSLVGIVLTITTLLIFKKLRKRDATKFHVQLCIAISGMLLVFAIGIDRVPPKDLYGGCVAVSALIHYFTLVAVMWMGAEALFMFQKLAIVFIQITAKYITIVSIVCWVAPIIPVVIPLGIDRDFMVNRDSANDVTFCFIGDRRVFFGAFLGPILAVLLFNLVMMIVVVTVLVRHMRNTMGRMKEQMKQKTALRLLISITGIMSLFGLTWIFGALTISGASLPFQILFVVFNGFQGFFIFLFLCVFSKDARKLWKESLSSSYNKFSTLQRSHKGAGTITISTGGTKKTKAAAGTFALTSLSYRKSEQPILSVTSDHEVSKNPSDSEDETPMLGGDNLIIKGVLLCIANPQAIDSPEIQPGEVQSPMLEANSKEVNEVGAGIRSSGEEIVRADAETSDNP